jgi:hypothetical protein
MGLKTYALTTVARTKAFAGISGSSYDTLLENLINSVTEYIEKRLGRRVKQTAYTNEVYNCDDGQTIKLKNFPVSGTFKLEVRDSALNEDDWEEVDAEYYYVDNNSGLIKTMSGYKLPKGIALVRVSYTAGYNFDNAATFLSDTQGGDIEYAAWKLVTDAFMNRKSSQGVTSERIGDYSVSFAKTAMEDEAIKALFDQNCDLGLGGGQTPDQELL